MMSCATPAVMSNILKAPKMLSPSHVVEHGLLVGILLVLMNAAITLETLEVMTGVVGALAVCVMKANASKRRISGADPVGNKGCKIDPCLLEVERETQLSFANETSPREPELVDLKASVQAELSALRAEWKLESEKKKTEEAEAELAQLHDKVAELEKALSRVHSVQVWTEEAAPQTQIEVLLTELTEAKLRVGEVEAELVQAQSNMVDLENHVAQAASIRSMTEQNSQARIEATYANDHTATDVTGVMWMVDSISVPFPGDPCSSSSLG